MIIIGIDPGAYTGIAVYKDGALSELKTIQPYDLQRMLEGEKCDLVVFEDSRLQSHIWTRGLKGAAAMKVARNIGQIDAWCSLIETVCKMSGIETESLSPKAKGEKVDALAFYKLTGYDGRSNQHERDAAMVALPFVKRDNFRRLG